MFDNLTALLIWCSCTLAFGLAHIWIAIYLRRIGPGSPSGLRQTFLQLTQDLTLFVFAISVAGAAAGSAINVLAFTPAAQRRVSVICITAIVLLVAILVIVIAAVFHAHTRGNISPAIRNNAHQESLRLSFFALLLGGFLEFLSRV